MYAHIYVFACVYIYTHAVKSLSGPSLALPVLLSGPSKCYLCCPLATVDEWRRVSQNRASLLDALFCLDLEPCGQ